MRFVFIGTVFLFAPLFALGALPPNTSTEEASSAGIPTSVKVTCYAPGGGGIQGPFETSRAGAGGRSATPSTLDDFRLGKSPFVTLAGNPKNYGKWFNLGTISYVSNLDNTTYTMSNVMGYVHDTGSAFWPDGKCYGRVCSTCRQHKTCADVYRKYDIAYGDFRGNNANIGLVNSQAFCGNRDSQWVELREPLTTRPIVSVGPRVADNSPKSVMSDATPGTISNQTPRIFTSLKQNVVYSPEGIANPLPTSIQPSLYFTESRPTNDSSFIPAPYTESDAISNIQNPPLSNSSFLMNALLNMLKPIAQQSGGSQINMAKTLSESIGSVAGPNGVRNSERVLSEADRSFRSAQTFVQNGQLLGREGNHLGGNSDRGALNSLLESLKSVLGQMLGMLGR